MATAEVHIVAYDVEEAAQRGQSGAVGYTFTGMTPPMRTVLISHLEVILRKLHEHAERYPDEESSDGADEVRHGRRPDGDPREERRPEDGVGNLHGEGHAGAHRGEQAGRQVVVTDGRKSYAVDPALLEPDVPKLILPPGVRR